MKRILVLLLICWPFAMQAANIPTLVNANRASSHQMCVNAAANDCVNTMCLNSPDRNCTDRCQKVAEDKCH